MTNGVILTSENFDSEVLNSDIPVLVDFWAEWCMPCRLIDPILEEMSQKYSGRVKVGKLNVDQHNQLATKYSITSLPALIMFKNRRVFKQHIGAAPKAVLEEFITSAL